MSRDEECRCYVGKLPTDITKEDLRFVFKTYGKLTDIRLSERENFKQAIITYETRQSADSACQVLHEQYRFTEDCTEPITCTKGPGPRGGGKAFDDGGRGLGRNINDGKGYRSRSPGYERGGPSFDRRGGMVGGYGHDMHGPPPRDMGFEFGGFGGDKGKGKGKDGGKANFGSKIYIANLPPDITKDALEYVFGMYGVLTDLHIMNGRSKTGQGCAFATFGSPIEARRCIAAMAQGYEIRPGDGELIVRYADGHDTKGKGKGPGRGRPF